MRWFKVGYCSGWALAAAWMSFSVIEFSKFLFPAWSCSWLASASHTVGLVVEQIFQKVRLSWCQSQYNVARPKFTTVVRMIRDLRLNCETRNPASYMTSRRISGSALLETERTTTLA